MPKATVLTPTGDKTGELELPAEAFDVSVNPTLLWEAVRMYLANRRQGNAQAKTRGEIKGSRHKVWSQKHTGRARHGDRYSPIFKGGGVAHGPRKREYGFRLPRKALKKALAMSLSDRAAAGRVLVVKPGFDITEPKTKRVWEFISNAQLAGKNVLIVSGSENRSLYLSGRNISRVKIASAASANTYDVLWSDYIVLEEPAVQMLKERVA